MREGEKEARRKREREGRTHSEGGCGSDDQIDAAGTGSARRVRQSQENAGGIAGYLKTATGPCRKVFERSVNAKNASRILEAIEARN